MFSGKIRYTLEQKYKICIWKCFENWLTENDWHFCNGYRYLVEDSMFPAIIKWIVFYNSMLSYTQNFKRSNDSSDSFYI